MRGAIAGVLVAALILLAADSPRERTDNAEVIRIQHHLEAVSRSLRSAPTAHLTPEQQSARRQALDWLDEYRAAGVFPHNHVRPGERVSVFVDPHGTPCAVGYLMLRSGEDELVEEIARTDNLVRVHALRDDERVADWLHAHGLTLDEAALIQPMYDNWPPMLPIPPEDPVASSYRPATVGLSIATAALASFTAMSAPASGSPWAEALAVGTAIGHTYMVVDALHTEPREPAWAVVLNMFGAVASVGTVLFRIGGREAAPGNVPEPVVVRPYVAPGPYGTEVGFAFRH